MAKISDRQQEFFKFCVVGAINTGIDFSMFAALSAWGVPLLPAHILSYSSGVINSFLLNRRWTFKESAPQPIGQLVRFVVLNLCTLTTTYGLLVWFHFAWGWPLLVSRLMAVAVSLVMNFGGSRLWVFWN
ncbi:GtrA family protein [Desulfosporosinus sp. SB140]|uniref:GtrA family protein n=1 Tax=Desulfosporosinus paludis TaxID=3115649 RepID=UPI00388EB38C